MINNKTRKTIISQNFSYKSDLGKAKGLLFKTKPETIVFKTRFGIHTFMLKFPIDIMVLTNNRKVVFIRESIKPNNIVFWNPKFNLVIEMPDGTIKKSNTKIGDLISL